MGWTTDRGHALHAKTGARNMREHRARKREQAEVRSETTPPERMSAYRRLKTEEERTMFVTSVLAARSPVKATDADEPDKQDETNEVARDE